MDFEKSVKMCVDAILESSLLMELENSGLKEHEKHLCIIECIDGKEIDVVRDNLQHGVSAELESKPNFFLKKLAAIHMLSIYRLRTAMANMEKV